MITILFGPPGSGKGTQAAIISQRIGVPHVSTGQMLRDEVARGSALGAEVAPIMQGGGLISDDLMVRIIESRLAQPDAASGVLLDGFPRTVPQAEALDAMLERSGKSVGVILCFDVPLAELQDRIARRAGLDGRADDTPEAFMARMQEYQAKTAPVLDHYRGRGTSVVRIDGGRPIEAVTGSIIEAFGGPIEV